ncbi:hypothetical protein K491DRAFT_690114 [Lophiostoma macrostomum CBS 122681]|uniref:DUF2306 domain-containing protein n=1 Tax=Lophiostoma macrostomum CBS 122681 TaxID=1314788 RepID=A0A6A6TEE9_9PLEO|nr:hypothetical protein K491DRAFT_690114 [Lophiostoma macrostomum CBS 122681]
MAVSGTDADDASGNDSTGLNASITSNRQPSNHTKSLIRILSNPLGFQKRYNTILFLLTATPFLLFTLASLPKLSFPTFCGTGTPSNPGTTLPGECYYYLTSPRSEFGIRLHLAAILPAALLAFLQFVPRVRRAFPGFHRWNGYVVAGLAGVGSASAMLVARRAAGGGLETQSACGVLCGMTVGSLGWGVLCVRRGDVGGHRRWMVRFGVYFATPLTTRLIIPFAALIISNATPPYYQPRPCAQVAFQLGRSSTLSFYPECAAFFSGEQPDKYVLVQATLHGGPERLDQVGACLGVVFGMALWLAIWVHGVGAEVYLHFTREDRRGRGSVRL